MIDDEIQEEQAVEPEQSSEKKEIKDE